MYSSWIVTLAISLLASGANAQGVHPQAERVTLTQAQSDSLLPVLRELGVACDGQRFSVGSMLQFDPETGKESNELYVGWDRVVGGCSLALRDLELFEHGETAYLVTTFFAQGEAAEDWRLSQIEKTMILKLEDFPGAQKIAGILKQHLAKTVETYERFGDPIKVDVYRSSKLQCSYAVVPNAKPTCTLSLQPGKKRDTQ